MYLSTYLLQHVYQWNRPVNVRFDIDVAIKLRYLTHMLSPYVKLHNRLHAIETAILDDDFDTLKWLYTHFLQKCERRCDIDVAVEYGRMDIVQWLYENHIEDCTCFNMKNTMLWAAEDRKFDILRWLIEKLIK